MTDVELKTVLEIMSTADGGCPSCVRSLFAKFFKHFPEIVVTPELLMITADLSREDALEMIEDMNDYTCRT